MFAWWKRFWTPVEPLRPRAEARLTSLENQFDDIDSRLDYLASELKKIRGRQFASEKRAQDDVGHENVEQPDRDQGAPHYESPPSTAHLARRFRGW